MPKYYCDYCDTYLTHDSPSVRKTHCNGRKHKENVRLYYQGWMEEQAQKMIDSTTAAFTSKKNVLASLPQICPIGPMPNMGLVPGQIMHPILAAQPLLPMGRPPLLPLNHASPMPVPLITPESSGLPRGIVPQIATPQPGVRPNFVQGMVPLPARP